MENSNGMIQRIAIIGPESSGKTSLAQDLALYFDEPFVEEFARAFLEDRNGHYEQDDLDFIANQQLKLEEKQLPQAKKFIFCDTNPLIVKVWSTYKYGNCSQAILDAVDQSSYALHLLLFPDLEYEVDPLRENPNVEERKAIFTLYEQELKLAKHPYAIVKGMGENRIKNALHFLKSEFSL